MFLSHGLRVLNFTRPTCFWKLVLGLNWCSNWCRDSGRFKGVIPTTCCKNEENYNPKCMMKSWTVFLLSSRCSLFGCLICFLCFLFLISLPHCSFSFHFHFSFLTFNLPLYPPFYSCPHCSLCFYIFFLSLTAITNALSLYIMSHISSPTALRLSRLLNIFPTFSVFFILFWLSYFAHLRLFTDLHFHFRIFYSYPFSFVFNSIVQLFVSFLFHIPLFILCSIFYYFPLISSVFIFLFTPSPSRFHYYCRTQ